MRTTNQLNAKGTARWIALSALAMLLLTAPALLAQSFRGSIRGEVRDQSGAVIPSASVLARNLATGEARSATTGPEGTYVLSELPAGDYDVSAEAKGFRPYKRKVAVVVGTETTAHLLMSVGLTGETITIDDTAAPLIETTQAVLGGIVENRLVEELPLNGRDFGKLVALVPGATVEASGVAGSEKGFGQFNINGNRDRSNNYTLDGTDNNDPWFNNSALNQVGIAGAPATLLPIDAIQEFNLQGQFAAEYGRNSGSVVNIITKSGTNRIHGSLFEYHRNSFFDARNFFNVKPNPQSHFVNNQFGGSIGGPIVKDRTFFFGAYEGQRERVASDFNFTVPTLADRATAFTLAQTNGLALAAPNPAIEKLLNLYYSTGVAPATRNVPGSVNDKNDLNNFILKVDHRINSVHSLAGRYAFGQSDQIFPFGSFSFGGGSRLGRFAQESPTRVQVVSASWLSVYDATHINEVRFGYTRFRNSFRSIDDKFDPLAQLGFNFGNGKLGLPEFDFGGAGNLENLGTTGFDIPRARTSQSYQILDNFTWIWKNHTFKFGGEFRRANVTHFSDTTQRGILSFSSSGIAAPPGTDPLIKVLANLYLGTVFPLVTAGDTHRETNNNGSSFFGQDEWRARPNLTFTFGLRWEYFGPLSEKNGLLSNLDASGNLVLVGSPTLKNLYERDLNNFAPRIGVAWNALSHTVVRAAYGFYYDYVPQQLLLAGFTNVEGSATNLIGPKAIAQMNPFGGFVSAAFNGTVPGPIYDFTSPNLPSVFSVDRHLRTPYVQTWNLNIQRELGNSVAVEIGYVGTKGTKLTRLFDLNNNFNNITLPNFAQAARFSDIANSTYHALQFTGRLRDWKGFSGFTSYTFSKSLDDASDGFDFTSGAAMPQDSTNIRAEHGPSLFDARHRYTLALNYQVPMWSRLSHWISEGWQLNSIFTAQSGKPIPIDIFIGNSDQRPDIVPGVNPILSHWTPSRGYLNPLAFQALPSTRPFGNLGRNRINGPGFWNADFSITKNTKVRENLTLQFRTEFFNIFNHPIFALPNNNVIPGRDSTGMIIPGFGPAGIISQTPDNAQGNPGLGGGGPRVLQFALRLKF